MNQQNGPNSCDDAPTPERVTPTATFVANQSSDASRDRLEYLAKMIMAKRKVAFEFCTKRSGDTKLRMTLIFLDLIAQIEIYANLS
ncbi:hypothetical protein [Pseudomonas azerbaijanoccidentalis]